MIRAFASRLPCLVGKRGFQLKRSLTSDIKVSSLTPAIQKFIDENVRLCRPDNVYVCDGSERENQAFVSRLIRDGRLTKLEKYENCYLARTDPADVARVESRTFVCTERKEDAVPIPKTGVEGMLGNWKPPGVMDEELGHKFHGCMTGRTMYVIPFCMGPVGSPLSKIGVQLTDSEYVVASMRIMTRMGKHVLDTLGNEEFIRCLHSVGHPLADGEADVHWPCNPSKVSIVHFPERNEIKSFGSGYGGNSLLGKKCVALRIASILGKKEGWLAEHTLILGLTNPQGVKKYIVAAFPSACGKTNLAMIKPTLPGWKAECVGDDIAWMKFDNKGRLRAINPEAGFFGVAPGTSNKTNAIAMATILKDTIFTNVAETSDGGVYWEGLEKEVDFTKISITDWKGKPWTYGSKTEAAHPNSRFCVPAKNCPDMDPRWEDPEGVPIDAILFGGRRPAAIPLVYEAYNWRHGVFVGASMRSESTAAAEHQGKQIMHDPFAMRPFFGYSFAQYLGHWLSLECRPGIQLPKIFHVNWFRKNWEGQFLWPGFGDNSRVLDWILRRCDGEDIAVPSPIGLLPKPGSINTKGLKDPVDMEAVFKLCKDELKAEALSLEKYFNDQLPGQLPLPIKEELDAFKKRIAHMSCC